jgi:hypothetical protein
VVHAEEDARTGVFDAVDADLLAHCGPPPCIKALCVPSQPPALKSGARFHLSVDARRRVFDRIVTSDDDGIDPETARRIRYAIRLTPDRDPDRVFADMRRNGVDPMLDRYVD